VPCGRDHGEARSGVREAGACGYGAQDERRTPGRAALRRGRRIAAREGRVPSRLGASANRARSTKDARIGELAGRAAVWRAAVPAASAAGTAVGTAAPHVAARPVSCTIRGCAPSRPLIAAPTPLVYAILSYVKNNETRLPTWTDRSAYPHIASVCRRWNNFRRSCGSFSQKGRKAA